MSRGLAWRHARPPAFIWLPAVSVVLLMLVPPLYLAVRAAEAGSGVLGLLFNLRMLGVLVQTGQLIGLVTVLSVLLGVSLAWLTARTDLPLRPAFAVLTALPLVIPSYVFALLVITVLRPRGGILQTWLEPLGVTQLPDIYGLPGAALTLSLLSFPYVLLPVRAALYRTDPAMEEASRSLGHGAWKTFFGVTLPLLRPAIMAGALLVALYTLSDFGAVSLFRYQTFTWTIYIQYETVLRTSAAVVSLALVALALTLLFFELLTRSRAVYYRVVPGSANRAAAVKLGRWRWPAAVYAAVVVLLSLGVPLAVLVYWAVRGLAAGEPLALFWTPALNTLRVSGLAALAAVAAAIPIAILTIRYPSWIATAVDRLTYVGFALPGIAVGLGFVFFAAGGPLHRTTVLLVMAYVVLFLPAAVGAIQASLQQVSPRIEEAAQSLGRTPRQVFLSITLPLLGRGMLAGGALVLLLTMKELPATWILSPLGFQSLATVIWDAANEAFFARAAMGSILLVLVASVPMAFIVARERR